MNQHTPSRRLEAGAAPAGDVVRLVDLHRSFGAVRALDGISLTVAKGEVLGIIGRSGAGKSTLIRCLNGLERPDAGQVVIEGRNIASLSEAELRPLRRRVGMIFQHFNLMAAKTVEANVALPLKIAGLAKEERRARVAELLALVGLSDKARMYPAQLSGGQKQRVGIARALAGNPALLLSDEATSALDPETTRQILMLLKDINRKLGLTIVLITHEMEVVRAVADRVAVIEAGRIIEEGPVWQVFATPREALTKSLLGTIRPELTHGIAEAISTGSGDFAVIRADIAGSAAGRLLADLAEAIGTMPELLQGGIDHIQGQPVGSFFLKIPAANGETPRRAVQALRERGALVEELGYV